MVKTSFQLSVSTKTARSKDDWESCILDVLKITSFQRHGKDVFSTFIFTQNHNVEKTKNEVVFKTLFYKRRIDDWESRLLDVLKTTSFQRHVKDVFSPFIFTQNHNVEKTKNEVVF